MSNRISPSWLAAALTTLAVFLTACSDAQPDIVVEPADRILISQHVLTMTSEQDAQDQALAVAVRGGQIVWVGNPDEHKPYVGSETVVEDLGHAALLPGFIDAHGHVVMQGGFVNLANVASPPVGPATDIETLQNELAQYIEERSIPSGEWVIGTGYDDSLLAEQRHPNRDDLDAVSIDHPIMLLHVSGHLATANAAALALAGIEAETPNPSGGVIRRRPGSDEPDGVMEESALYPFYAFFAQANSEPMANLTAALELYASFGITTAQDGASSAESVTLLRAAADAGLLSIDTIAYPVARADASEVLELGEFGTYHRGFKLGGGKLVLDGSPQGKTAWLAEPYHIAPHGLNDDYAGYPVIPPETTNKLVAGFVAAGVPLLAHANGDAAAEMLIDAVEATDWESDHRTVMIHAQTVREDQLDRMAKAGIVPSFFSAHTFYWGDWHRDSVLGEERGRRISPTASTLARGMPFTVHNDAPIVPPDMVRLLWATTNRTTRSGKTLGEEQQISTYQALRAITSMAAYQNFEEDIKGTIEVGKQADLVVLSANPLTMPTEDLLDLEVAQTIARGKTVYQAN